MDLFEYPKPYSVKFNDLIKLVYFLLTIFNGMAVSICTSNVNLSCSKPPWQSISKTKLQLCQLAKPYKIDDYSGPSRSLYQCFFVELSHCWLYGGMLLSGALKMILKIPSEAYFQPAYVSVVINVIFIFTDTCSYPIYFYLFLLTIDT